MKLKKFLKVFDGEFIVFIGTAYKEDEVLVDEFIYRNSTVKEVLKEKSKYLNYKVTFVHGFDSFECDGIIIIIKES